MRATFKVKFFLLVGWQVLLLAGLIVPPLVVRATGATVVLRTIPVDPRELFRGDYVALSYDISRLDLRRLPTRLPQGRLNRGDTVYTVLVPAAGNARQPWSAAAVFAREPTAGDLAEYGPHALFVRGTVVSHKAQQMQVEYGIESYFVPEGRGQALERERGGALTVEVKVDTGGRAVIQQIRLNGKPLRGGLE
jgi:uncharacterized membrane-anchored protein